MSRSYFKYVYISVLSLGVLFFVFSQNILTLHAHEMQTDGSISALLHVDPNDDPYIKEPAFIHFEFRDKNFQFRADQCQCTVTISEAGVIRYSATSSPSMQPFEISRSTLGLSYIFPEKNIYTISVSGTPLPDYSFTPFTLTYDLRVANDRASTTITHSVMNLFFSHHSHHIIIYGVGFIVGVLLVIHDRRQAKSYYVEHQSNNKNS